VLRKHSEHTKFDERRHPEEFSGRWSGSLRGMWGVPPRNGEFIGRAADLGAVARAMQLQGEGSSTGVLSTIELVGMGGVGKSAPRSSLSDAHRRHCLRRRCCAMTAATAAPSLATAAASRVPCRV
jgi:hypothetical protein